MAARNGSVILELNHITKSFGKMVAVNDVSFSLERGKLVTFVGPSGCGKTTLLRAISGFAIPDSGTILLDGKDITHTRPNARDTAMVFQNYALFPHMSVAKNIGFGLRIRRRPAGEVTTEVNRLLALTQLDDLGDRKPHELSGGQQQRVALARALSLNPKILLLDEPLSNLDANLRVAMRDEIRNIQRKLGLTIIFVTHDQEEAMSISDLIVVMDGGIVKQIGSPTEVYEHPVDEFVANFVGHINFFNGEVISVSNQGMTFRTRHGIWNLDLPGYPVFAGDRLKAVVRPESIDILPASAPEEDLVNTIAGKISNIMYIGSIIRYTIRSDDQSIYVDESDPQYRGISSEGDSILLKFKNRLHMLKRESDDSKQVD